MDENQQNNDKLRIKEIFDNADFTFSYKKGQLSPNGSGLHSKNIADDFIVIIDGDNKNEFHNSQLSNNVRSIVESNLEKIKYLASKKVQFTKATAVDQFNVMLKGDKLMLSAMSDDQETKDFYAQFVSQIVSLFEQTTDN